MAIDPTINRYRDYMSLVPEGAFYDRDGIVVPYRDKNYEFRFTTDAPSHLFGIFLNGTFTGTLSSDALGNLVVSIHLDLGENVLEVVQSETQERIRSFVTCRHYAGWGAAYADELERVDDYIDEVRLDSNILQAFIADLEAVWGERVGQPNNIGYDPETYRNVLHELLQAYRLFGAKVKGHEVAIAAFCQVPPLDYYRKFDGKRWVLATNFLTNGYFDKCTHSVSPVPAIPGLTLSRLSADVVTGAASLSWHPIFFSAINVVTYSDSTGSYSISIDRGIDGDYALGGPGKQACRSGVAGPFSLFLFANSLQLDIDCKGLISISLPIGAAVTAAQVATAINAALATDPRYGIFYNSIASDIGGAVVLRTFTTGPAAIISFYPSSAMQAVFGLGDVLHPLPQEVRGYIDSVGMVSVTNALLPAIAQSAAFIVYAAPNPDDWFVTGTGTIEAQAPRRNQVSTMSLHVTSAGADIIIRKRVDARADKYKGFEFQTSAWVRTVMPGCSAVFGRSFDGVLWEESAAVPIPAVTNYYQDGFPISDTFIFDPDATSFDIRIRVIGPGSAFDIYFDRVAVTQPEISGEFLRHNTILRNRHRSFFGHLVWAWCPDLLSVEETQALGFGAPPNLLKGQIDRIGAAHTQIDRFDVSTPEYDYVAGVKNLKGCIDEAAWASSTLYGLELVPGAPSRFSYVRPTVAGVIDVPVVFGPSAPHYGAVTVPSDRSMLGTLVLRDGVPITQNGWSWFSATVIQLDPSFFNSGSTYSVRYHALYQAETAPIDLGEFWEQYVWFADYYGFFRYSAQRTETEIVAPIVLDYGSFQAALDRRAVMDVNISKLVRDDGVEVYELPKDGWGFADPYTVRIDGSYVKVGALYTLTYREIGMTNDSVVSTVFEVRSSTTEAGLATATYKAISRNQAIKTHNSYRYHQLRATFSGIDDLRDLRVSSMTLKGLNLFGSGGTIPGLRP